MSHLQEVAKHLGCSVSNPILTMLASRQVTPEHLLRICNATGCNNLNDFLAYFEPKQEYIEEHVSTGNGTTATETQHYIDMEPNKGTNPQQHTELEFPDIRY